MITLIVAPLTGKVTIQDGVVELEAAAGRQGVVGPRRPGGLLMVARASSCTRHSAHARRARRAFSLLEVMVAIAILGLTLTVILSAQGGLAASNRSAANMGQAVAPRSLQDDRDRGAAPQARVTRRSTRSTGRRRAATNATPEGFTCDTKVEKVELPN